VLSSTRRAPSSGRDTTSACSVLTRLRTPKSRRSGTQAGGAPTATRPSRRRWLRAGSVAASSASSGSARSSSGSRARFGEGSTGSVNAACTSSTASQMSASHFCDRSSPNSPRRGRGHRGVVGRRPHFRRARFAGPRAASRRTPARRPLRSCAERRRRRPPTHEGEARRDCAGNPRTLVFVEKGRSAGGGRWQGGVGGAGRLRWPKPRWHGVTRRRHGRLP